MDPVNPTPHLVRREMNHDGVYRESLVWPLHVKAAHITLTMEDEGSTYTLDCDLRFRGETHDVFIIEETKLDENLQPMPLVQRARFFMELKGEMVPAEDGTAYTLVMENPGG